MFIKWIILVDPKCLFNRKGDSAMRKRWLALLVLLAMVLATLGAAPAQDTKGTLRGYVFRDSNQNGLYDSDEEGIPGVYVTISHAEYQHTYYTGAGDENGDRPGPGSYGPTPLQPGYWKVVVHVPDGYRATSRTDLYVDVPAGGAATGVNFGLNGSGPITYSAGTGVGMGGAAGSGILPATGGMRYPSAVQSAALLLALVGLVTLIGTPWCVARSR
jgi:hypothetical protein